MIILSMVVLLLNLMLKQFELLSIQKNSRIFGNSTMRATNISMNVTLLNEMQIL